MKHFKPEDNPLKDVKVQIPSEGVLKHVVESLEEAVAWLSPWEKNQRRQRALKRAGYPKLND